MKYLLSILISLITFNVNSLELTLSQGTVKPTPIAVTDLFSQISSLEKIGKNISSVISDNLERSGLFIPIDQKAFIQSSESLSNQPRFEDQECKFQNFQHQDQNRTLQFFYHPEKNEGRKSFQETPLQFLVVLSLCQI